ncbi:MAG: 3-dehydroquinate synthase [Candidatus Eremiobacteraeota bacterium]|nr:3-dehydroquinate synthase [Candidatus Eremiobacteraeota bacterium]MBC5803923.1 3-dehydroquinate synthase [Candidatus Eremiobacteraeota bacterium]MBC5820875.1 3-dehydroquinate synthase [Candidatus Eremiobacteraeota bacterium]
MTRLDLLAYPIVIDERVAAHVAAFVRERGRPRCIVLADRNVAARGAAIARALGRQTPVLDFALGERRKTLRTLEAVLGGLARTGADRATTLVGVGGGVAGDLFGFAAAVYMRGVAFINVATSLVAMVDAAIGGKTGVDLAAGKNLAGTFRDPVAVFCDLGALGTLPERYAREGLAELVKHGIIEGGDAFEALETLAPHPLHKWPWETVIAESMRVKAMYVNDDRLEVGAREVLNLGHTFGHAIERVSGYRISHGAAVSIGLRGAGLLALRSGRFSQAEHLRVLTLLTLLRLPLINPSSDIEGLLAAMAHDKKVRAGALRFVVPRTLGDVEYGVVATPRNVRAVLQRLHTPPGAAELR